MKRLMIIAKDDIALKEALKFIKKLKKHDPLDIRTGEHYNKGEFTYGWAIDDG